MSKIAGSFCKKTLRRFLKKSLEVYHVKPFLSNQVYNSIMTRNYFSRKGGPYFVGQTFSQHSEKQEHKGLGSIPIIGKVTSLLKFPRFKRDK
jgi:hypothetical protein